MKNHPIITAVYILISLALVSLALYLVFWYSPYNPDNSQQGDTDAVLNNMYFALYSFTVLIMIATLTAGFLQARIKGVAQYVFYFVLTMLLPIPTMLYHMTHCNGKFCGAGDFVASSFLTGFSVGTIIVYYLGRFLAKKGFLHRFLKCLYILIGILLCVEIPLYLASAVFDYTFINYTFSTGDYLFGEVSLPHDFIDIAMVVIPALLFALYSLKIAEAEHADKNKVKEV